MLVLSRKKDESIVCGPSGEVGILEVFVIEIRGDKVRLGIVCPKEWFVHRREVYDLIQGASPEKQENP